jgi:hypothetical protein
MQSVGFAVRLLPGQAEAVRVALASCWSGARCLRTLCELTLPPQQSGQPSARGPALRGRQCQICLFCTPELVVATPAVAAPNGG